MNVALEAAWRDERHLVIATVARRLRDLQLAEEAVQEAFARAAARWPIDGVPDRPGAWLTTTAYRVGLDHVRGRRPTTTLDEWRIATTDPPPQPTDARIAAHDDDVLVLVVTCCHRSPAVDVRVALTLRHVCGLTVDGIAAGFLVTPAAMAKRLVRARRKLRDAGAPFEVPDDDVLPARLADARHVAYLVFTEGHQTTAGDGPPVRTQLCEEAIWLARQVRALRPDPESDGLLALLLLQHARSDARRDAGGRLVVHDRQPRRRWDASAIAEARDLLAGTGATLPGRFQVEAAIAVQHTLADGPDWAVVANLYTVLHRLHPSLAVALNRAYATGRADGGHAGLLALAPLLVTEELTGHAPLHAVHADLLELVHRADEAADAWRRAIACAPHPAQRARLRQRLAAHADGA